MSIKRFEYGSAVNGKTLAEGCKHCIQGSKMVLLVTGRCDTGCFYCPVSAEKKGKDVIYANEKKVLNNNEIIAEAESMDATGTGITGGDPLGVMERTVEMITLLKGHFGQNHHIHLYTSMIDLEKVRVLKEKGLDEIRFHPSPSIWDKMETTSLKEIIDHIDIDVGIEVPAIPKMEEQLNALIQYSTKIGVKFINLNELEFSESNWDMMEKHGFEIKDDLSSSVLGSEELAIRLMKNNKKAPIHFCSSVFKDGVQLRQRLIRRAQHTAKEYDVITEDGTIIKGLLYSDDLDKAAKVLCEEYNVPSELMFIDKERNRMEVASWVLEELADELPFKCYIVEEYSTADRLEVERTPLN
ncbi:MAG: radical SAM protein [Candidatus Methanogranum gryphiswaldense]|nr:MAG: radical SAM protein [Candidatus Methanogranum sp. U3.2.1]